MESGTDGNRVDVSGFVRLFPAVASLEQIPELVQCGRRLSFVDATGEHVRHMLGMAMVHHQCERKRKLPEGVKTVFEDVYALFAEELMIEKRIRQITIGSTEIRLDERCRKLSLSHRHGQPERENRIDEAMCI